MNRRPLFAALLCACVACGPDETISGYANPQAVYGLRSVDGEEFAARATIAFPKEGEVTGTGPCNGFRSTQSAPYPWFALGPIAATRRACADLALEQTYFDALASMTLAEVSGPVLLLSNTDGRELVFQAD
ncbi:MAG: META domain-containing protein [Pseudomonadota bacterium]